MKFKDIKNIAKNTIKYNYAALLAVCFLLAFLTSEYSSSLRIVKVYDENTPTSINGIYQDIKSDIKEKGLAKYAIDSFTDSINTQNDITISLYDAITTLKENKVINVTTVGIILTISVAFIFLISNPIIVGSRNFLLKNVDNKHPKIREINYSFKDKRYFNIVKIMALKSIYLFLYTFTIIGLFIKYYEYCLIPYLLAENPNLTKKEVFKKSKELMMHHKFECFLLNLSFILWDILGFITFGLSNIFYANLYKASAKTIYYNKLKELSN